MRKLLFFLAMAIIFATQLSAQTTTVVVGDTTTTSTSDCLPMRCYYNNSYSQSIYPASSLEEGMITSISYYHTSSSYNLGTAKIYMQEVSGASFASGFVSGSEFVEVFTGPISLETGWVTYTLPVPFTYTGEGDLLVAFIRDASNYQNGHNFKQAVNIGSSIYVYDDYTDYSVMSPPNATYATTLSQVPLTQFEMLPLGTEFCYPPINLSVAGVTQDGATISWEVSDESSATFAVEYKGPNDEEWILADGAISETTYTFSGLESYTEYQVKVYTVCNDGNSTEITSSFITLPSEDNFITIPFEENFDDLESVTLWELTNPSANKWYIGALGHNTTSEGAVEGGNGLYISGDDGATNTYQNNSASVAHASVLLNIEEGSFYEIAFDYKSVGEGTCCDYVGVRLVPFGQDLGTSTTLSHILSEASYGTNNVWERIVVPVPASITPGAYYLSFSWRNDSNSGENPPAAIDNVSIYSMGCSSTALESSVAFVDTEEGPSVEVSLIDTLNSDVTYKIRYKTSASEVWTEVADLTIEDFPYAVTEGLTYSTNFNFQVGVMCDDLEDASYAGQMNITIPCATFTTPWSETFDVDPFTGVSCWNKYTGMLPSSGQISTSSLSSASYNWNYSNTTSFGGQTSGVMYANPYSSGQYYWLVTPSFNLGDGDVAKQFAFNVCLRAYGSDIAPNAASDDRFIFMVSLDNGLTWDIANGIAFVDGDQDNEHNFSSLTNQITRYFYTLVDAEGEPLTGTVRFAFYVESTVYNGDNLLAIDNLSLEDLVDCPAPYTVSVNSASVTSTSATASFGYYGTSTAWEYVVVEGGDADPDSGDAVELETTDNIELTDLSPATTYTLAVRAICESGTSEWTVTTFTTLEEAESIPYETAFDDDVVWTVNNGSNTTNTWVIGEGTGNEAPAAYISNDGETYAATINTQQTITHIWKDFDFDETEDDFELSFDWKATGRVEGSNAYGGLAVYLVDRTPLPESGFLNSDNVVTVLALSDEWQTERVFLGNVTGEKRLVFTAFGYTNNTELTTPAAIDNVSLVVSPCSQVQGVELSNATSSSFDVAWTETGADSYIISYRPVGTEEVLTTTATSSPFTLEELVSSTQYYVAVTAVCGSTEAIISSTEVISTLQESVELPYTCDFEEEGSNGWLLKNGTAPNKWYVGTPSGATSASLYISNNNGTSAGYTTDQAYSVVIAEKLFQLGASDSIRVSFDISIGGESSYDFLKVFWAPETTNYEPSTEATTFADAGYITDLIMNNFTPSYSYQANYRFVNLVTGTQNMSVTIPNDNPNGYKKLILVWKNDGSTGNGQGAIIDNVVVEGAGAEVSCVKPVANSVVASVSTETTATISWTDNDESHSAWNVYYRANGEEEWSSVQATETSVELVGLLPSTMYSVYVTTDCGDEESGPTSTAIFNTACAVVSTFPYVEGFETETLNSCWTRESLVGSTGLGDYPWLLITAGDLDNLFTSIGQQSIWHTYEPGVSGRLITPIFDLTSLSNPYLKFNYNRLDYFGAVEGLTVQYRTSADETWTELASMTGTPNQWILDSIALPNPSETYQIAFVSMGDNGYGVVLDDFTIYDAEEGEGGTTDPEPDPCDAPTALAASNITETTADITWTGTATSYEVRLNGGAAESVSGTTKQYTSLTANTAYTVEVRAVCEGQTSDWASVQFTTLAEEVVVTPPSVSTLAATNITHESAVLNGTITAGNETITAQGFMYKATAAADWTTVNATGANITATVTALAAETEYSYKAFATTASGIVEGTVMTFTTTAAPVVIVAPEVTTLAATSVDHESAVLNGTITAGTEEITAQGFMYKATAAAEWTTVAATGANITATVTALTAETEYTFKAFATTASGTVEGTAMSFTTTAAPVVVTPPTVVTLPASTLTHSSAVLNGTVTAGSEAITAQGFMYKATSATEWTTVAATGENMSVTVEGLESEMAYDFKAFATTASGTVEGEQMSFITLSGLNDAETINAMIYPNPADDKAIISVSVAGAKIVVSDMQGRIIMSDDMTEETYEMNVANYTAGVYYIRIISGNTVSTQKLIVK